MNKFIEFTDKSDKRTLVNLNCIKKVIDRNKSIIVELGEESFELPLAYESFKTWIGDNKPIQQCGHVL